MTKTTYKVAIIGGGISGLATAYYLQEASYSRGLKTAITLLEKSNRLGGVIRTERTGGYLLEWGPEGFAANKPWVVQLVRELRLEKELAGSRDEEYQSRTYVSRSGKLLPLPQGMVFLSPVRLRAFWKSAPLTAAGKLRAVFEPFVPKSRKDLSVRAFLSRRLGEEFTRIVAEPLISAIYGTDPGELSIRSSMPDLYRLEQEYGSLWKGLRRFSTSGAKNPLLLTFKEGMQTLIQGLAARLEPEVSIHLGCETMGLEKNGDRVGIAGPRGKDEFDLIIFCSPAHATARLLKPFLPRVSKALEEIPYSSSRLVYLAYDRLEFSHPLNGFGFVVPPEETLQIDACTWVSSKFNHRCPSDKVLLRCAIHGRNGDHEPVSDEAELLAHEEIRKRLGITCRPVFSKSFRVQGGMPRMLVGHENLLQGIDRELREHPQLMLAGAFTGGVGVPDRIRCARQKADEALERLIHPGLQSGPQQPKMENGNRICPRP